MIRGWITPLPIECLSPKGCALCLQLIRGDWLILQPKVVSDTDDAELKELMERFEKQNMDVAGDDDSDEDDE
jgi:hypothetical protein